MANLVRFIFNLLMGIDEFGNVLLLGSPEEPISSRLGRAIASGKAKWFVSPAAALVDKAAYLIANQKEHCINSIQDVQIAPYELWSWIKE